MVWLALAIPILAIIIQAFFFHKKVHLYEYLLQFFVPLILIGGCKALFSDILTRDTEYWGGWIEYAVFEEDWNEYIHQTCSYTTTDSNGNTTTHYYDCSYVAYHPDKWWMKDSNGSIHSINSDYYYYLKEVWDNEAKTGYHDGHTNDGDIFQTVFANDDEVLEPIVVRRSYKNKVAASDSVFNFQDISREEVKSLGLFEYPTENLYVPSVLGYSNSRKMDVLNAKHGAALQLRVWVLVYTDKSMGIFEHQKNYWKNGNKNELIIGFGIGRDSTVKWANVMTWCENSEFVLRVKGLAASQINRKINIDELADSLYTILPGWKRKQFADFNYLRVEPPLWTILVTYLVTLICSVTICIINIKNDFHYGETEIESRLHNFVEKLKKWKLKY